MLGIDISDRSIKVAEVVDEKSPHLRTVCWSPLDPAMIHRGVIQDVRGVSEVLRQTFVKCSPVGIQSSTVVASIPEVQSFVRVIEVPQMPDSDVEEAIQWAVRQHIPFDLDMVYIDWQPLEVLPTGRRSVLVGAVQRDVVDPLLSVLDEAGLMTVSLELEAQAIVRSLLPRDAHDVNSVLIVDMAATSTNIIFFDGGVIRYTTSIQSGGDDITNYLAQALGVDSETAEEKKAVIGCISRGGESDAIAYTLRAATKQLIQKVEQVVREIAIQVQGQHTVRAILLSGGSANLPGIIDMFGEGFPGVPAELGNPWMNFVAYDAKRNVPLSPQDANHFVTAFGLALRNSESMGITW